VGIDFSVQEFVVVGFRKLWKLGVVTLLMVLPTNFVVEMRWKVVKLDDIHSNWMNFLAIKKQVLYSSIKFIRIGFVIWWYNQKTRKLIILGSVLKGDCNRLASFM